MITEPIPENPTLNVPGQPSQVLDKDDFLRLLVTQLRHQDPLNPMRGEEFAAQLAQFSSVEQLHNINQNLGNGLETDLLLNQSINNMMATTLIGKEVQALGNTTNLTEGETPTLQFRLASAAAKVTIRIVDPQGTTVRVVELSGHAAGDHSYVWDGKDNAGDLLPEGEYRFSVNAVDAEGSSVTARTYVSGIIASIRYEEGGAILRVGDQDIELGDVIQIGGHEPENGRTE